MSGQAEPGTPLMDLNKQLHPRRDEPCWNLEVIILYRRDVEAPLASNRSAGVFTQETASLHIIIR